MKKEICRYVAESDIKEISKIIVLSWQYAYKGIVPQDYLDSLAPERWEEMFAKQKNHIGMVLETDDKLVGAAFFCNTRDDDLPEGFAEIVAVYLLPDYCNKGLGGILLGEVLNELKNKGYKNCNIWTLKENIRAHKAYEKNGFAPDGTTKIFEIGGKELTAIRFIKEL